MLIRPAYAALALLAIAGCSSEEPAAHETAETPRASPVSELSGYGQWVARTDGPSISFSRVADMSSRVNPQDSFTMIMYRIEFAPHDIEAMRLHTPKREGDAIYQDNDRKSEAWRARFCTPQLAEIMRRHEIDILYGSFQRQDTPIAQCTGG